MRPTEDPRIDGSTATIIVGSDEVGFGAWAGPLVVAAVAAPRDWTDPRVKDSKKLSERQREAVYGSFYDTWPKAVVLVSSTEIDHQGVWKALLAAHLEAIHRVRTQITVEPLVIVDGNLNIEGTIALPKGDQLIPAISLASIFAKVTRDRIMVELDKTYPGYDFAKSRGYGVPKHQAALNKLGPCPAHRRSYEPVARAATNLESPQEEEGWILDDY